MESLAFQKLTARQRECLKLLAAGGDVKSIARALGVSPNTVTKRLQEARLILGVPNSRQAARMLLESEAYSKPISSPIHLADSGAFPAIELPTEVQPKRRRSHILWRLFWPVPTREHPTNDMTSSERIQSSLLLTGLVIVGGSIVLMAVVQLFRALITLSRYGSYPTS